MSLGYTSKNPAMNKNGYKGTPGQIRRTGDAKLDFFDKQQAKFARKEKYKNKSKKK